MKKTENTGLGTPRSTVFAEYDFAAVDKSFAVEEQEEAMSIFELATSPIQCDMHAVSGPYQPLTEEERAASWAAINEIASSCGNRFQHILKLSKLCRWFATKDRSLNPMSFVLDWLDLTYRRRRRIGATITTVDRLFSLSSCGGWTS